MRLVIAIEPQGKERPRVTRNGIYMPHRYQDWRRRFVAAVLDQAGANPPMLALFALGVTVATKSGKMRPDLDNVLGAVLDALQDAGLIANDRDCQRLTGEIIKSKTPGITITLEEVS